MSCLERHSFLETTVRLPLGGCASSVPSRVAMPGRSWRGSKSELRSSDKRRSTPRSRVQNRQYHRWKLAALAVVVSGVLLWVACGSESSWCRPLIYEWGPRLMFILVFCFGSFNFCLYLIGFCSEVSRRVSDPNGKDQVPSQSPILRAEPSQRVPSIALAMAIYHEDTQRVLATIRTMWLSMQRAGLDNCCDFFLLCDSEDPEIRQAEQRIYRQLVDEFCSGQSTDDAGPGGLERHGRFFLIRRAERTNYKAGNISHFLECHGWKYDYLLVLDADSLMLGYTVQRMVARMEANPQLGLLQTVIIPIGSTTLFARVMQYSIARCFPLFAVGISRLLGKQCVYWGHNALVRVRAFMEHANLPILPGGPPFGGNSILSHDIIEAALLGRAGYAVEWIDETNGSFDSLPQDILSYARRDRRWCQGNFQHFWLIFGDRVKPWHRFYFANGIFSYLTGPLIIFLSLWGFGRIVQARNPFQGGFNSLFLSMLLVTVVLPKCFGLTRIFWLRNKLARHGSRAVLGRAIRESLSTAAELLLTTALAPLLFYLHTRIVLEIVMGSVITWKSQRRQPAEPISWGEAASVFWVPTFLGAIWLGLAGVLAPHYLPFLSLLLAGWIFSVPLAVVTSSPRIGTRIAALGLFEDCLTEEEAAELGAEAPSEPEATTPRKFSLSTATSSHRAPVLHEGGQHGPVGNESR